MFAIIKTFIATCVVIALTSNQFALANYGGPAYGNPGNVNQGVSNCPTSTVYQTVTSATVSFVPTYVTVTQTKMNTVVSTVTQPCSPSFVNQGVSSPPSTPTTTPPAMTTSCTKSVTPTPSCTTTPNSNPFASSAQPTNSAGNSNPFDSQGGSTNSNRTMTSSTVTNGSQGNSDPFGVGNVNALFTNPGSNDVSSLEQTFADAAAKLTNTNNGGVSGSALTSGQQSGDSTSQLNSILGQQSRSDANSHSVGKMTVAAFFGSAVLALIVF